MFADSGIEIASHSITVLGAALLGVIGGCFTVYFYMRGKAIELRRNQSAAENEETKGAFANLKDLAAWQSDQYKKRSEEVDTKFAKMGEELTALRAKYYDLHLEHMDCERDRVKTMAQLDALREEVKKIRDDSITLDSLADRVVNKLRDVPPSSITLTPTPMTTVTTVTTKEPG